MECNISSEINEFCIVLGVNNTCAFREEMLDIHDCWSTKLIGGLCIVFNALIISVVVKQLKTRPQDTTQADTHIGALASTDMFLGLVYIWGGKLGKFMDLRPIV